MDLYSDHFAYPSNNQYTFQIFPQSSSEHFCNSLSSVSKQRQDDQNFLTMFDINLKQRAHKVKTNSTKRTIRAVTQHLKNLLGMIDNLKEFDVFLRNNYNTLTDSEWSDSQDFVKKEKGNIDEILTNYSNCVGDIKKLILKRNSKRCRITRKKSLDKKKYATLLTERAQKSKAIDEKLQKIQDDIQKVKEEEDLTRNSNITLKEVLGKKADAKKNIALLESLVELRNARINTAKGRGEQETPSDTLMFTEKIGKLIKTWKDAFETYSTKVQILRASLDETYKSELVDEAQTRNRNLDRELNEWRVAMFGGADAMPQRDFQGNLEHFISVRSRWDQFLNIDGSSLPSGWLLPAASNTAENENNAAQ